MCREHTRQAAALPFILTACPIRRADFYHSFRILIILRRFEQSSGSVLDFLRQEVEKDIYSICRLVSFVPIVFLGYRREISQFIINT